MNKSICHVTTRCNCHTIFKAFWEVEEAHSNALYNHMTLEKVSVVERSADCASKVCLHNCWSRANSGGNSKDCHGCIKIQLHGHHHHQYSHLPVMGWISRPPAASWHQSIQGSSTSSLHLLSSRKYLHGHCSSCTVTVMLSNLGARQVCAVGQSCCLMHVLIFNGNQTALVPADCKHIVVDVSRSGFLKGLHQERVCCKHHYEDDVSMYDECRLVHQVSFTSQATPANHCTHMFLQASYM